MKNKEIEIKLNTAVSHAVPDVLKSVLCDTAEGKGTVTQMTNLNSNKKSYVKIIGGLAAAIVFIIAGFGAFTAINNSNKKVDSVILLDVNPSIELSVNKNNTVLSAKSLNSDAGIILEDMELEKVNIDVALNAILGSMVKNGYITEAANSVLLTVENDNTEKGDKLKKELSEAIYRYFNSASFSGAVLSQSIAVNETLEKEAADNNVSVGKAQLIEQIISQNSLYKFEELAALSVNELNLLAKSNKTPLSKTTSIGTASDKKYIGSEKAKEIAFSHAGVTAADVKGCAADLDFDDGIMVYDVEFFTEKFEYDCEISALTGNIVSYEKESVKPSENSNKGGSSEAAHESGASTEATIAESASYIGASKAKTVALNHAVLLVSEVKNLKAELDTDNGVVVYEVSFENGIYEYDYEINAKTGAVVKHSKEFNDDIFETTKQSAASEPKTTASAQNGNHISKSAAEEAAFKKAGVSRSDVKELETKLDTDEGAAKYEVSFNVGVYEYDVEINASTGSVIDYEKELAH